MNTGNKYCFIILLFLLATACKEDEIEFFNGKPAINMGVIMENGRSDTLYSVSFGFREKDTLTVNFIACLQGIPADHDRKIRIDISGTAQKDTDYTLSDEFILPAGAHQLIIPCLLRRTPTLLDQTRTIVLTTVPDDIFDEGLQLSAHLKMSDGLPTEWVGNGFAEYTLGPCTKLKYQFFYDILGFYDLGKYSERDFKAFAMHLNNKVDDYNANPEKYDNKYGDVPMTDETGQLVIYAPAF